MLTTNFASGFGSYYNRVLPETVYPAFSQTLVFNTATAGTRIKLPNYVNTVRVYAWGGGGAGGGKGPGPASVGWNSPTASRIGGSGGNGGFVQADFPIPPGAILNVRVGGGGASQTNDLIGGGGGGYSSVELPVSPATPDPLRWLLIAGGGGGGGNASYLNAPSPGPLNPTGAYYAGYNGGPAHSPGSSYSLPGSFLDGKAAVDGPYGPPTSFTTGQPSGTAGMLPIGAVYPTLIPLPIRPIYAPYTPPQGPSALSEYGTFLKGGGGTGSGLTGAINGGGIGYSVLPTPRFPGIPAMPPAYPTYAVIRGGGGGGGLSGGGQGHPIASWSPIAPSMGEAGGGGGRSYINPNGSNISRANTGPYAPNPIFTTNYIAKPASSNTKADTASGGLGYVEDSRTPDPSGFFVTGTDWLGQAGGDGLVVIVY